jgi:threonine dehydrogenase-like Zn-dependent dehydrogenase
MRDSVERYKQVDYSLPESNLRWELYGVGLENLGRDGKPVRADMPGIGPGELLARVDAVGLCFSDIKLITQGSEHPRISGRDLLNDPTVPGHEASLTIVKVGEDLKDRFSIGERYLIQADVSYGGASMAFGYVLAGALQQFTVIGKEIIDGDEGCYLLPVRGSDGYAEVALSEPWACVVAAHRITHRETLKPSGTVLFVAADPAYSQRCLLGEIFSDEGAPRKTLVSGLSGGLDGQLVDELSRRGSDLVYVDGVSELERLADEHTEGRGFDDIVVLGTPAPEFVEQASRELASGGIFAIVAESQMSRKVQVDVGRVHYDGLHFVGARTKRVADAYRMERTSELKRSGKAWIVGAGGPMGQMHTQLAASASKGPALIVATDIDDERLGEVEARFGEIAHKREAELVALNPTKIGPETFGPRLRQLSGENLFDDVMVMAPVPSLIEQGADWVADGGVLNVFAGVPRGTMAHLDVGSVYRRGVRWVGSSGSLLSDMRYTLEQTQKGELSPNHSVAAIGGIYAVAEGLKAVKEGTFPGKVVIWPQLVDLPLIPLTRLSEHLPEVAEKLTLSGMWTADAEEELLRSELRL